MVAAIAVAASKCINLNFVLLYKNQRTYVGAGAGSTKFICFGDGTASTRVIAATIFDLETIAL
jgi:hypothetical protein